MQNLPTILACLLSTALVSGCTTVATPAANPAAVPTPDADGWSSAFKPAEFRGDAAFRFDATFHGEGTCRFEYEASGIRNGDPIQLLAMQWGEDAEGRIGSMGAVAVVAADHVHASPGVEIQMPSADGWMAEGMVVTDDENGSAHWVFFGNGLEPRKESPGLALSIQCEGDVDVGLVGGGKELHGFVPGSMSGGSGAMLNPYGPFVFAAHEEEAVQMESPLAVFAVLDTIKAAASSLSLTTPTEEKSWSFGGETMPAYVGPAGPYKVAVAGAGAGGFAAMALFGGQPIEGLEGAVTPSA